MSQLGPSGPRVGADVPASADFVVVGAGIVGAAVAHQLARRGASVVVFDQAPGPAAGATGRSGGMVRGYDADPLIEKLALASLAVYRDPRPWSGGRAPLRQVGAVTLEHPDRAPALRAAAVRINAALGTSAYVAVADEILGIRTAGGVALVEPEAGWVEPAEVAADWLAQARGHGAAVCHGVRVRAVEAHRGRPGVYTDAGVTRAAAVVAAVGPWAGEPVPGLRSAAPVRSRSIQVSIVERRPPAPAHPTFIDLRTGGYAKPVGPDRTLIGLPHLVWDSAPDAPPDPAHARATRAALTAHFPWLATAAPVSTVRSADAYHPPGDDRAHGLLERTGVPHVWCVRAWNGGGVKTAPEAGRRIAQACVADAFADAA